MSFVNGPFEARSIVRDIFIQQCIQVSISTLLVYDICEYKILLITPFPTTFIIVITYDKEVSTIIDVGFVLMYSL